MSGHRMAPSGLIHDESLPCCEDIPTCRPVAVIDPEDREAAFRLVNIYFGGAADDRNAGRMIEALREFAKPKPVNPDEPLAPGAVVVDREGVRWVSWRQWGLAIHERPWQALTMDEDEDFRDWCDIDVDEIVFEGVKEGDR